MSIFSKIGHWFQSVFSHEFTFLKANSKVAVDIVNVFKEVADSPVTLAVLELLPTKLPAAMLDKARPIIDKVALEMALAYNFIQDSKSAEEVNQKIIEEVKKLVPTGRASFFITFAGRLNQDLAQLDGHTMTLGEAVSLAQMVYAEIKNPSSQAIPVAAAPAPESPAPQQPNSLPQNPII